MTANPSAPDWWPFKSFTPEECRRRSDMHGKPWIHTGSCWVCLGCGYKTPQHGRIRVANSILKRHDHDCDVEHVKRVTEA